MTEMTRSEQLLSVGQVADRFGVTVRTLHHYDDLGLLRPAVRSPAGYRRYTADNITRLQHVVVYRRLGFALDEIAVLLDDPAVRVVDHLRRQRDTVMARLDGLHELVTAIDHALEREMTGIRLSEQEQRELFGEGFGDDYADEAKARWGDTDAWKQSQERTTSYTKQDWQRIKDEGDAVNASFVAALDSGLPPTSAEAMDVAERARRHIDTWFYDITPDFHRCLGDMYVEDERFAATYESQRAGLAAYARDAIHANAARAATPE